MSYTVMPSVLSLTNTILREIGEPAVGTMNPGTLNTNIVLEAINDCVADIYNRGRFEFQKVDYTFALVAGQNEYQLPSDFKTMELPLRVAGSQSSKFVERTAEEFWNESYGAPNITSSTGSPSIYYIGASKIHLWPTPDAGFVASAPNLTFTYYKNIPARLEASDGSSSPDLPLEFYDAVKKYGKSRLKEYLQFDDAMLNYQQYEQALQIQQNRARQGLKSAQMRQQYGPSRLR